MSLLAGLPARAASPVSHRQRPRAPIDWTLLIGLASFGALLALALYGPIVAPHDFYYVRSLVDGKAPPFAPGREFPLGSDEVGHDLLSWLLIGARSTLVIAAGAATLRMAIGGFFGTFAGWQGGWKEEVLTRVALAFSSVPATVLAVLGVLAFNIYAGTLAFTVALGLLGWGDAFHHARRHARAEGAKQFIESARAMGMSETRVVLRHLLPGMAPSLLTLATLQVSAVLLLLGELGLIRLFVGGADIADFDPRSAVPSLLLPTQPDWSSMLAQTRPITDLYGTSWMVLVPGLALLATVVGTNLLGDALARRAQRLDVYRLFSRRQMLVLVVLLVAFVTPGLAWPSRLAPDLDAAASINGTQALAVGRALSDPRFGGRIAGTPGALAAADVIRAQWSGELQSVSTQVASVSRASIHSGTFATELGPDLSALSLQSASVSGTLRELDRDPVTSFRAGTFKGQILVTSPRSRFGPTPASIALAASAGDAVGVIIVDDDIGAYGPSATVPVPTVRMSTNAFRALAGALPLSLDEHAPALTTAPVQMDISARHDTRSAANVVAHTPAAHAGAPLILVLVPYDEASYPHYLATKPSWGTASAIGVASEVLNDLRRTPLPADLTFVAVGADSLGAGGTTSFLSSLDVTDRQRVIAAVTVGSLQTGQPFMQAEQADRANPGDASPSARVGGRVAAALGLRTRPTDLPLRQLLRSADASAPVFGLTDLQGADEGEPSAQTLRAPGRDLLVLLSYIAHHPEELRP